MIGEPEHSSASGRARRSVAARRVLAQVAGATRDGLDSALGGPARTRVIVTLACVLALNSADTATVGASAVQLRHALHISNADIGLLVAVTSIVGAVASIPFGVLVDRVHRMRILVVTIVFWGLATLASASVSSFGELLLLRLLLGGVTAASGPAVASLIGDYFPSSERGKIYGYVLAGELLGAGVGFVITGDVAALSWRAAFAILAVATVPLVWAVAHLPEPARGGASQLAPGAARFVGRREVATRNRRADRRGWQPQRGTGPVGAEPIPPYGSTPPYGSPHVAPGGGSAWGGTGGDGSGWDGSGWDGSGWGGSGWDGSGWGGSGWGGQASGYGPQPGDEAEGGRTDAQREAARRGIRPNPALVLHEDARKMGLGATIRYVLAVRTNVVLVVAGACGYFFLAGVETFGIEFVRGQYGVSQIVANLLMLLVGAGAVAGVLVGGRLGDTLVRRHRLNGRILVAVVAAMATTVLFIPAVLSHSSVTALPYIVIAAFMLTAQNPPMDAARLDIMPPLLWGRAEGIRSFLRTGAQALAPLVFGGFSDLLGGGQHGLQVTFIVMLAPLAASGFILLGAMRTYPVDVATAAASSRPGTGGAPDPVGGDRAAPPPPPAPAPPPPPAPPGTSMSGESGPPSWPAPGSAGAP